MLTLSPAVRIYLATDATDLRRSIDGLSALVRERFALDPLFCGGPSLPVSQLARRPPEDPGVGSLRLLGALTSLARAVCDAWPTEAGGGPVEMRSADLLLLLSGVEIAQTRRRRWYARVA